MATDTSLSASTDAWDAIRGAYDIHIHVDPDVIPRRVDDVTLARDFLQRGLRGFVLKSHYIPTAERAKVVCAAVPGIRALGSLTLNHSVGGLNPVAVDLAGRAGARVVWMPTVDAANETAGRSPKPGVKAPAWAEFQLQLQRKGIAPDPLTILGPGGDLSGPARECLALIAEYDMVLATGHLGAREIFALVEAAAAVNVKRVVVTHPEFPSQNLSAVQQARLVEMGAFIEHCFTTMHTGKASWETLFANLKVTGTDRCVLSTDLGQKDNPPVAEGFAAFAQRLLDAGLTGQQVRHMTVENTRALMESD